MRKWLSYKFYILPLLLVSVFLVNRTCKKHFISSYIINASILFLNVESVKELVKELWRYGLSEEATTLARQANSLLLTHRASLSIIWCNEITGAQVCSIVYHFFKFSMAI